MNRRALKRRHLMPKALIRSRRKGSAVRAVLGADRALEVEVRHAGSQTIADVRQGSWKTNIVSNAVWLVATGGMNLAVSGWSVIIQKDLESYIRSLFAELGGVHMVDLTDGAAVRQGQLACNLPDVPAENPNMFPCPDCGNSVSRFAAACPQCGRPVVLTPEQRAEQEERERQREAERERLAREQQERERDRAERLAVQRQREHEEELERQREAQCQWDEHKRQWDERKRKALRWAEERSRATLVVLVSVARWLLRRAGRVLRGLTRHRRDVRIRRVLVPARWWGRKADRALGGWSSRLGTLNEAGMRRCLWLVSATVLILVLVVGAFAMSGGGGKRPEPIRAAERQDGEIQSTPAAPAGSHGKALTKAQEEQIRLRLQALYASLYSLPASVPLDQGPAVMQQEANLRAQIADLEAELAGPSHPPVSSEPKAANETHPSPAPTASDSTDAIYSLPTGWVKIVNRETGASCTATATHCGSNRPGIASGFDAKSPVSSWQFEIGPRIRRCHQCQRPAPTDCSAKCQLPTILPCSGRSSLLAMGFGPSPTALAENVWSLVQRSRCVSLHSAVELWSNSGGLKRSGRADSADNRYCRVADRSSCLVGPRATRRELLGISNRLTVPAGSTRR